ncbi:MAG: hypothetical protein ACI4PF_02360 [Christensenellales bacterium]
MKTKHIEKMFAGFIGNEKKCEREKARQERIATYKKQQQELNQEKEISSVEEDNRLENEIQLAMQRKDFATAIYLDKQKNRENEYENDN